VEMCVACTTLICGISRVADAVTREWLRSNESEKGRGLLGVYRDLENTWGIQVVMRPIFQSHI